MNNGKEMTVKSLLIGMMATFLLKWGRSLCNAVMGGKFQKVQYDP